MRKLLVISFLVLLTSICYAEKEDIGEFDGNSWIGWTAVEKISFLRGYLSASGYIILAGSGGVYYCSFIGSTEFNADKAQSVWNIYYDTEKSKKATFTRQDVSLILDSEILSKNESLSKFGIYGITVGQIYESLNLFYNDFKNKQIKLYSAVHVVKKQITGASSEEIEAVVQWLRGGEKDFNKRFYIDKEGKKKYVAFP